MSIDEKILVAEIRTHAKARHALSRGARQSLFDAADRLEAYEAAKTRAKEQPVDLSYFDEEASEAAYKYCPMLHISRTCVDGIIKSYLRNLEKRSVIAMKRESVFHDIATAPRDGRRLRLKCVDADYDGWYEENFGCFIGMDAEWNLFKLEPLGWMPVCDNPRRGRDNG